MIIAGLLTLLAGVAAIVSVPFNAIPLPDWFTDGTIAGLFAQLRSWIDASGATYFLDLGFVFSVVGAWWSVRLGLIPVRWLLGVAGRFLGRIVPTLDADGTTGDAFIHAAAPRASQLADDVRDLRSRRASRRPSEGDSS